MLLFSMSRYLLAESVEINLCTVRDCTIVRTENSSFYNIELPIYRQIAVGSKQWAFIYPGRWGILVEI